MLLLIFDSRALFLGGRAREADIDRYRTEVATYEID